MNLFDNLKLRTKLLGAFLILIGLLLATSATALVSQKSVTDSMDHLLDVDVRIAEIVAQTDEAMLNHTARRERLSPALQEPGPGRGAYHLCDPG